MVCSILAAKISLYTRPSFWAIPPFPKNLLVKDPSFPWQDEALSVCLHKPQVYIDLSGWSPKYFPPQLVQYANTLLRTKVLFGSDYPMIPPDRWIADFEKLAIKPEVRALIMRENALRLLGLDDVTAPPAATAVERH